MHAYFGGKIRARPGRQHEMDADYFARIDAVHFAMQNDDGQSVEGLDSGRCHPGRRIANSKDADLHLSGQSRVSRRPAFRSIQGMKSVPDEVLGRRTRRSSSDVTKDARRLVQIRRNRLKVARTGRRIPTTPISKPFPKRSNSPARYFAEAQSWPVIDVSQRSVEEVAAMIMKLYEEHGRPNSADSGKAFRTHPGFGQFRTGARCCSGGGPDDRDAIRLRYRRRHPTIKADRRRTRRRMTVAFGRGQGIACRYASATPGRGDRRRSDSRIRRRPVRQAEQRREPKPHITWVVLRGRTHRA